MKKYLGAFMNAYAGICMIFLCMLPVALIAFILCIEVSALAIMIAFLLVIVLLLMVVYMLKYSDRLYSWGTFYKDKVIVKNPFRKKFTVEYNKLVDVGVGYYFHGVTHSQIIGSKIKYIYLSCTYLTKKDKVNLNMLPINESFIKVGYSDKLYNYLLSVLSRKQSVSLRQSKEEYDRLLKNSR